MKIYTVEEILNTLESCINQSKSFNLLRFGDGGLKYIHSLIYNDDQQLHQIIKKEGLPREKLIEILELWGYYARKADFIDTPEVYYNGKFWPRIKKPGKCINCETDEKMRNWRDLYDRAEFDNENYCNPEFNCLSILRIPGKRNLLDFMKNKKICCITAKPEIKSIFPEMDVIKIVGQWQNQYKNSFKEVIDIIKYTARNYDCWFVAAGELGRIYSGYIKECGGRSLDIGFIVEYWLTGYLHPRLWMFVNQSINNRLELVLTDEGKKYEQWI